MSLKINKFTSIVTQPHNTYRFTVRIPSISENIMFVCESTQFPVQGKLRTVELYVQGEKVTYPTIPENGGTWTCKLPESDGGAVNQEFVKYFNKFYNQKTGQFTPQHWDDVIITSDDLEGNAVFAVCLHGTFCTAKHSGAMNLDASNPSNVWKWEIQFFYNWLEDIQDGRASSTPDPMA